MSKQMERFSINPAINLAKGKNWLLAVTPFGATNSFFNITDENNSCSITTPSHWDYKSAEKTTDELKNLLELRSQKGIDLYVKEVWKRGNQIKV